MTKKTAEVTYTITMTVRTPIDKDHYGDDLSDENVIKTENQMDAEDALNLVWNETSDAINVSIDVQIVNDDV